MWIRSVSSLRQGLCALSNVAQLRPPSHLLQGVCLDKNCPLSARDCCQRCTVVKDLGSSASCRQAHVSFRNHLPQCNSARPRPPPRSTKILQSIVRILQWSLVLRSCKTSVERKVLTEHRNVLWCFTTSLHPHKQNCTQKFLTHRPEIRLRPRSKLLSCSTPKKRSVSDKAHKFSCFSIDLSNVFSFVLLCRETIDMCDVVVVFQPQRLLTADVPMLLTGRRNTAVDRVSVTKRATLTFRKIALGPKCGFVRLTIHCAI